MLILPLKTSTRSSLKDDLARWLDSNANSDDSFMSSDDNPVKASTFNTGPPPSFDMVLQNQRAKLTSAQCNRELQRLQSVRNCIIDAILKSNSEAICLINLTQPKSPSTEVMGELPLEANSKLIFPVPENKSNTLSPSKLK